jgi:6-phospho-beta-glucosidase
MKVTFIGGGALRHLAVIRGALAKGIFDRGEINLHDLNVPRAEAMGRMIMKTTEYAKVRCKVTWGTTLDQALEGADAVSVVLMAGLPRSFALGNLASYRHGFVASDQISPNGAFLALKSGPILMDIARKMERLCPGAWLIEFANPVPVLSAALNNHTKIKTFGICNGHTNHCWDLTRLMGRDEECDDYDLHVAGVNHCSFILKGAVHGQDLFKVIDRHLTKVWKPPKLNKWWSPVTKRSIRFGLGKMVDIYRKFGVLIFSNELDGVGHLFYEEMFQRYMKKTTRASIEAGLKANAKARAEMDRNFRFILDKDLDDKFWATYWEKDLTFRRDDLHITIKILAARGGLEKHKLVTSYPNNGAVEGFKDRTVLEYSQILEKGKHCAAGRYVIPDSLHGLMSALATHQTLLGDAIATEDPKTLHQALFAYPVKQNTAASRALYEELLEINKDEIPASFRKTKDYF